MGDWLSYSLSDFLLFQPRTYWRLFELHNAAWWPLPIATLAAGAAALGFAIRHPDRAGRWIALPLAAAWAWVAWSFLWQRYAAINWAAFYVASAFALQAILLLLAAWRGGIARDRPDPARPVGLALATVAILLYPLLAPLQGRPWMGAEVFGIAPDPTAIGTLGLLLAARGRWRLALLPVPLLWCALSGLSLLAMQADEAWILAAALLATMTAAALSLRRRDQTL